MDDLSVTSEAVAKQIDAHVQLGIKVCDDYWFSWKLKNNEMRTMAKEGEYLGGNIAPRHVVRTGKNYFDWVMYGPNRYGKRQKNWGSRIQPTSNGYTIHQLTKKSPVWEKNLIIEAEAKFSQLRKIIDALHECKIKLDRVTRSLKKES